MQPCSIMRTKDHKKIYTCGCLNYYWRMILLVYFKETWDIYLAVLVTEECLCCLHLQRPVDIIHRKKMSAIWFPYTTIEHLWCQLEETKSSGHMVDQCDKLKRILQGALGSHLNLVCFSSTRSFDFISHGSLPPCFSFLLVFTDKSGFPWYNIFSSCWNQPTKQIACTVYPKIVY